MLLYDPLGDGQAKSDASLLPAAHFVDAVETLEDFLLLFLGDAHSGILNRDDSHFVSNFERQAYGTGRGSVLEGVIQKDVCQPPEKSRVTHDGGTGLADVGDR